MADKYAPIEPLDEGGQGQVWLARRESDGLMFALKQMFPNPASRDPQADKARFIREIRCQTTLRHPNIAEIIAANTTDSPPWFVMPLARCSLRRRLEAGPIAEAEAVAIFAQILTGIEYAHSEGVLHRDLKPENVLLIENRWAIADFGLSRRVASGSTTITATNQGMGTLYYAAPEQWRDAHSVDERADVYSLGKMLYELFTGEVPFPSVSMPAVPPKYRWIIAHAIEDDPDKRYLSVAAMAAEFLLLTTGSQALAVPIERAKQLLPQVTAGDAAAIAALDQLLVNNQDDEVLYKEFVVSLSLPVLQYLQFRHPQGLRAVAERFLELAKGAHPFSYTDLIADFLANIYTVVTDVSIHRDIMERLLVLGYEHNRFHVGQVFARLAASAADPSTVMLVAQVMRGNPDAVPFNAFYLRQYSLPPQLSAVLAELG